MVADLLIADRRALIGAGHHVGPRLGAGHGNGPHLGGHAAGLPDSVHLTAPGADPPPGHQPEWCGPEIVLVAPQGNRVVKEGTLPPEGEAHRPGDLRLEAPARPLSQLVLGVVEGLWRLLSPATTRDQRGAETESETHHSAP